MHSGRFITSDLDATEEEEEEELAVDKSPEFTQGKVIFPYVVPSWRIHSGRPSTWEWK